ncbi:MAG: UDP-3-O-acyl-N-acetylglucosamine deacetylase [Acidobacteriota bacterium]|nr:UDP-3-O-acyl-N-acetylglucosamine deacetylase [Acidobacteriota bacterium]
MTFRYLDRQQTLAGRVSFSGVGLHTGVAVDLVLAPAPANTGVVFKRTDLEGFEIRAQAGNVARVAYATSLMRKGVLISTTEHLLSALAAMGVDNVCAEISNVEVPILDGSALPFVRGILATGLKRQRARRYYIEMTKAVQIAEGAKRIAIFPAAEFRVTCSIDFPHLLIGKQCVDGVFGAGNYEDEIAPARTFQFLDKVEELRNAGLVRGGSLQNAIVLSEDGVLNPEGLRFKDEFCRHKTLDLIGDFALLGHPILGHVVANRGGHALHYALVSRLLQDKTSWRLVDSLKRESSAA